MLLNRAPVRKGARLQSLLKAQVDEPPTPTENDVRPLSPRPHVIPDPQKGAPPSNRAPAKRDAPFPEPSNYILKLPVNGLRRFPPGPYGERCPSPELSSTPFPQSPR